MPRRRVPGALIENFNIDPAAPEVPGYGHQVLGALLLHALCEQMVQDHSKSSRVWVKWSAMEDASRFFLEQTAGLNHGASARSFAGTTPTEADLATPILEVQRNIQALLGTQS